MAEQEKKRDMSSVRDMMLKYIQLERGQIACGYRAASNVTQRPEATKREIEKYTI